MTVHFSGTHFIRNPLPIEAAILNDMAEGRACWETAGSLENVRAQRFGDVYVVTVDPDLDKDVMLLFVGANACKTGERERFRDERKTTTLTLDEYTSGIPGREQPDYFFTEKTLDGNEIKEYLNLVC